MVLAEALLATQPRWRQARCYVRWLRGCPLQSGGGGQSLQLAGLLHRPQGSTHPIQHILPRCEGQEADVEPNRVPPAGIAQRAAGMRGAVRIKAAELNQGRIELPGLDRIERARPAVERHEIRTVSPDASYRAPKSACLCRCRNASGKCGRSIEHVAFRDVASAPREHGLAGCNVLHSTSES